MHCKQQRLYTFLQFDVRQPAQTSGSTCTGRAPAGREGCESFWLSCMLTHCMGKLIFCSTCLWQHACFMLIKTIENLWHPKITWRGQFLTHQQWASLLSPICFAWSIFVSTPASCHCNSGKHTMFISHTFLMQMSDLRGYKGKFQLDTKASCSPEACCGQATEVYN